MLKSELGTILMISETYRDLTATKLEKNKRQVGIWLAIHKGGVFSPLWDKFTASKMGTHVEFG